MAALTELTRARLPELGPAASRLCSLITGALTLAEGAAKPPGADGRCPCRRGAYRPAKACVGVNREARTAGYPPAIAPTSIAPASPAITDTGVITGGQPCTVA